MVQLMILCVMNALQVHIPSTLGGQNVYRHQLIPLSTQHALVGRVRLDIVEFHIISSIR